MAEIDPETKIGRPTKYTPELCEGICALMAEGRSLRSICIMDNMPAISTVMRWLTDADKADFQEQYQRAYDQRALAIFEEMLDIADDGSNDWMERETRSGTITVLDHEHVQRSKLRLDARYWMLQRMAPKRFGDKMQIDSKVDITKHYSDDDKAILDRMVEKRLADKTRNKEKSDDRRNTRLRATESDDEAANSGQDR